MTEYRASTEVSPDHPCLPGHFPGDAVVPAVLLLQLVVDALHAWRGPEWRLRQLTTAKFLLPLRPGQRVDIVLQLTDARLSFRCESGDALLAQGSCEIAC